MQLRTTFVVERSERSGGGVPNFGNLFLDRKKNSNARAEHINGLKTACQQLLQTQLVLSFPALFSTPFTLIQYN